MLYSSSSRCGYAVINKMNLKSAINGILNLLSRWLTVRRLIDISPNLSLNLLTIGFYSELIGVVGERISARETPIKQ